MKMSSSRIHFLHIQSVYKHEHENETSTMNEVSTAISFLKINTAAGADWDPFSRPNHFGFD